MIITVNFSRLLLIALVSVLGLIQIPLDIRFHLLSRRATFGILVSVVVVLLSDTMLQSQSIERLSSSILVSSVVTLVYFIAHRVSPKMLGFGDVLLVTPLGLAVTYADLNAVLDWQLAASSTAGLHGIIAWAIGGRQTIAFGPYLIVTAWLILVLSI